VGGLQDAAEYFIIGLEAPEGIFLFRRISIPGRRAGQAGAVQDTDKPGKPYTQDRFYQGTENIHF